MVIYNINGSFSKESKNEGGALHSLNSIKPNCYYLKNSQFLKKEERDPELVRSTSREGYLIPINRFDLLQKYLNRFEYEEVYDSILDKPKEVQKLTSIQAWKYDEQRKKYCEIEDRCLSLGISLKETETCSDPSLMVLTREYDSIKNELTQIARDITHHEQNPREQWSDPKPLPSKESSVQEFKEGMLPEALRGWVLDIAERMQIPPDFSAASCVVALGSLIGRKIGIYPKQKDDWFVIPNLWGMVVGRPSLLKSPAIAEVMKPFDILVNNAQEKYRQDTLVHEKEQMLIEAQKTAFKDRLQRAISKGDESFVQEVYQEQNDLQSLSKPNLKRYKTEDATVEKIGEILQENPQGILVHRDELSGWLKSLDRYGREGDRAFYLESWNGSGSFTFDRIGRGTLHVPALCLSILGGIQPGPLSRYVNQTMGGGYGDDGFLQRFQVLVWPDAPRQWKNIDRFPDSKARGQAYEIFRKVDEIKMTGSDGVIPGLRFSSEAQEIFNEWMKKLEQKLRSGEYSSAEESHFAKYRSLVPSLSLIFHIVDSLDQEEELGGIGLLSIEKAILWSEYLSSHTKKLYAIQESKEVESAKALLERIMLGDLKNGCSIRDIYYGKHRSKLSNRQEVESAIQLLENLGWLRLKNSKTGGRPTKRIELHPEIRKFFV